MYIHRSVLLLFVLISLSLVVGMDWVSASGAAWYRPFLPIMGIILVAAWMQTQENDDY